MALPRHALFYWLAASLLYFLPGIALGTEFALGSKDAVFYTMILKLYGQAMAAGELYPRWFAEANAGQGSPVMIFYSPLSYFLTNTLLGWITLIVSDPMAHHRFLLGMWLAQIAAGFTCYLWLKPRFGEKMALLGSVFYIIVPYKFYYIWMHHNLAQLWALAWLPLWMLAAEKMTQGSRNAALGYGICLALVAYTHLLSLIAFAAVPALYALCVSKEPFIKRVISLAAAHAIGLALSAAYLLPMLFNRQFVWSSGFLDDFYSVFRHLNHPDTYFCLYYLVIAGIVAGFISHLPSRPKEERAFWFFVAVTAAVWLMTTPLSRPVWYFITPLQYLQFPMARLHSVLLVAGVWIALYGLEAWRHAPRRLSGWRKYTYTPHAAALGALACGAVFGWLGFISMTCYTASVYTGEGLKEVHRLNAIPPLEYITIWSEPDKLQASLLAGTETKPLATILNGRGELASRPDGNRHIRIDAMVESPQATIGLRQFYFPGWQAVDGAGNAYAVEADEKTGRGKFTLPHGEYRLEAAIPWVLGEKAGVSISLLMLLAIGLYWPMRNRL